MRDFQYVTIGHVTVDVMAADGGRRPGGGAFYSALQAARLGLRTKVVTKGAPHELEELLAPYRAELDVEILPSEHTTTLATSGMGAQRRQHVLAWAGAITEPIEVVTAILHLAAVARETPTTWQGRAEFVGITPQGLVREWDAEGEISLAPLERSQLPAQVDGAVLSERELPHCKWLTEQTLIAVTAGSSPTSIRLPGGEAMTVPVPDAPNPRDDLGAGDVFAAAFFVALRERRAPAAAAAYGNAAATVRIAGIGASAVGDRLAIEAALGADGSPSVR